MLRYNILVRCTPIIRVHTPLFRSSFLQTFHCAYPPIASQHCEARRGLSTPFWKVSDSDEHTKYPRDNGQQATEIVGTPEESLVALESLSHWLKNDETWRDETLALIDIPERTLDAFSLEKHQTKSDGTVRSYAGHKQKQRKRRLEAFSARNQVWYYDLLNPFLRRAAHDSAFRTQLQPVLNDFVQSGLGDRTFCDKYFHSLASEATPQNVSGKPKAKEARRIRERQTLLDKMEEDLVALRDLERSLDELGEEQLRRFLAVEEEGMTLRKQFNDISPSTTDKLENWSNLKEKHRKTDLKRYTRQRVRLCIESIKNELQCLREMMDLRPRPDTETRHLQEKLYIRFLVLDDLQDGYKQRCLAFRNLTKPSIALLFEFKQLGASFNETTTQTSVSQQAVDEARLFSTLDHEGLDTQKEELEEAIQACVKKIEKMQPTLKGLNRRLKNRKSRLPVVNAINDQVESILQRHKGSVCEILATYISDVHSRLLLHYRALNSQSNMADPHEWFPRARAMKRKIIFHGGPTNSGKTFNALQRLRESNRGMYYGPLRLLAAEVYDDLNSHGIACNLYTGQEKRYVKNATHGAATIEIAQGRINSEHEPERLDVVVIDEVQMLADEERGAAWTRGVLGLDCPEIHVCGGLEAAALVQSMAESCGDDFELKTYDRFKPLEVEESALDVSADPDAFQYTDFVQRGDCIVTFTKKDIFAIRREIESSGDLKCAVVYGTLPPSTRAEQARLFNDPDSGYDILIATDAIGMGLNLNIRRIIFNSIYKFSKGELVRVGHTDIKQIAGRAGRKNSPFEQGLVTCRSSEDLPHIRSCLQQEIAPLKRAAILPTPEQLEAFSKTLEDSGMHGANGNDLHHVLLCFNEIASVDGNYFLGDKESMHVIAEMLQNVSLSLLDKYTLSLCPVMLQSRTSVDALQRYAVTLEQGEHLRVASHCASPEVPQDFQDLTLLCDNVNELDLLLWAQQRFKNLVPINEEERAYAQEVRAQTTERINEALLEADELGLDHCYITSDRDFRRRFNRRHKGKPRRRVARSQRTAFVV